MGSHTPRPPKPAGAIPTGRLWLVVIAVIVVAALTYSLVSLPLKTLTVTKTVTTTKTLTTTYFKTYVTTVTKLPKEVFRACIANIVRDPGGFLGVLIAVKGRFMGWRIPSNLPGPAFKGPPVTRSDWVLADDTGWIYVSADSPGNCGLSPLKPGDIGRAVEVVAEVRIAEVRAGGATYTVPYLYVMWCCVSKP